MTAALFRPAELPDDVAGALYLASLPGHYERLQDSLQEMDRCAIQRVVCHTGDREIEDKVPAYARALRNGDLRRPCDRLEVADSRAPADGEAFRLLVERIARRLREGETILVHCAGGIGRTATFVICLLMTLGWTEEASRAAVRRAGSRPESDEQNAFIAGFTGPRPVSAAAPDGGDG